MRKILLLVILICAVVVFASQTTITGGKWSAATILTTDTVTVAGTTGIDTNDVSKSFIKYRRPATNTQLQVVTGTVKDTVERWIDSGTTASNKTWPTAIVVNVNNGAIKTAANSGVINSPTTDLIFNGNWDTLTDRKEASVKSLTVANNDSLMFNAGVFTILKGTSNPLTLGTNSYIKYSSQLIFYPTGTATLWSLGTGSEINGVFGITIQTDATMTITIPAIAIVGGGGTSNFSIANYAGTGTYNFTGDVTLKLISFLINASGTSTTLASLGSGTYNANEFRVGATAAGATAKIKGNTATIICKSFTGTNNSGTTIDSAQGCTIIDSGAFAPGSAHTWVAGTSKINLAGSTTQTITTNNNLYYGIQEIGTGVTTQSGRLNCDYFNDSTGTYKTNGNSIVAASSVRLYDSVNLATTDSIIDTGNILMGAAARPALKGWINLVGTLVKTLTGPDTVRSFGNVEVNKSSTGGVVVSGNTKYTTLLLTDGTYFDTNTTNIIKANSVTINTTDSVHIRKLKTSSLTVAAGAKVKIDTILSEFYDFGDHQVFQRKVGGNGIAGGMTCDVPFHYTYIHAVPATVTVRVLNQIDNSVVKDWTLTRTITQIGTYTDTIKAVPQNAVATLATNAWYKIWIATSTGDTLKGTNKWGVGDLIIIGGQSNALSAATLVAARDTAGTDMSGCYYHADQYASSGAWKKTVDPTNDNYASMGPKLATNLVNYFKVPIGIINTAQQNTSFVSRDSSTSWGRRNLADSSFLYTKNLYYDIANATDQSRTIKSFVWYQGESDAQYVAMADSYTVVFDSLKKWVRTDFGSNVPIFIAQIAHNNAGGANDTGWSKMRNYQYLLKNDTSVLFGGVTYDLLPAGDLHINAAGNDSLANRVSNSIINFYNGAVYDYPRLARTYTSGDTIYAQFNRLLVDGVIPTGFLVNRKTVAGTISSIVTSGNKVIIKSNLSPVDSIGIRYMYGANPTATTPVTTIPGLPVLPVGIIVTTPYQGAYNFYVSGSLKASVPLNANDTVTIDGNLTVDTAAAPYKWTYSPLYDVTVNYPNGTWQTSGVRHIADLTGTAGKIIIGTTATDSMYSGGVTLNDVGAGDSVIVNAPWIISGAFSCAAGVKFKINTGGYIRLTNCTAATLNGNSVRIYYPALAPVSYAASPWIDTVDKTATHAITITGCALGKDSITNITALPAGYSINKTTGLLTWSGTGSAQAASIIIIRAYGNAKTDSASVTVSMGIYQIPSKRRRSGAFSLDVFNGGAFHF